MRKIQRYQHETLVRARDFGKMQVGLFPELSPGGMKFAELSEVVATIEEHMKNRVAGTRAVHASTRAKVLHYMRVLAQAARQMARTRRNQAPFILPRHRRLKVEVVTARAFLDGAGKRQAEFIRMGLPETFVSDFTMLVDKLDHEVDGRLSGKTMRGQARVGIADALRRGMHLLGDLDVIIGIAAREDDVVTATWRIARRVEGQGRSARAAEARRATDAITASPAASAIAPTQPAVVASDTRGRAS